jgi:hypothetical protein
MVTLAAYRDKTPIDPYNMFVVTVASAHRLAWLHMAFSIDVEVERYIGRAYADKYALRLRALPAARRVAGLR